MSWENVPNNIEDYEGFIYEITNNLNGRKYIGKKLYWFTKKLRPLKGKKNKRVVRYESDWKSYWGSSKELLSDIEEFGEVNFSKRILQSYCSKWECSYYEAKLQFDLGVLFDPSYYNGIIQCRLRKRK